MPEYLSPGVYIEEISTGPKPIEGVSTSTAGFIGATERGPETPRLVTSWLDFQRWYGSYVEESYLPYAVQGFFDNGGQRCFVARVVPGATSAPTPAAAQGAIDDLQLIAVGRGAWGNNIAIIVEDASNPPEGEDWFRIVILYYTTQPTEIVDPRSTEPEDLNNPNRQEPDVFEDFDNLTHRSGATNNVIKVLNSSSRLLRVRWDPNVDDPGRPGNGADFVWLPDAGGSAGTDGDLESGDFTGSNASLGAGLLELLGQGQGLEALATIDEISLLVAPDDVREEPDLSDVTEQVLNQCERLKDRFAIVSARQGLREPNLPSGAPHFPPRDTSYAAYYLPWIYVYDPSTDQNQLIPATGHIAGIYARTDIERGVHKAPANEIVRGARDLEFKVTKQLQDMLNPRGINCLRDFRSDGRGLRVWGARTMSRDGEWKYINVRRLFLFIEESIDEATQWVVFEPNTEATWARVRRSITNFLIRVWRNGALMGTTEDEAFFVKCDRSTMTQDDIDNGRLICYIGIAPAKPAEFVIFRFSQKTIEA